MVLKPGPRRFFQRTVRLKPGWARAPIAVRFIPLKNDVIDSPEFSARKIIRQLQEIEDGVDFRIVPWRVDHDRS